MSGPPLRARSLMFIPGGRSDMVAKVARIAPDVAVVDLEDAVAAADKDAARRTAVEAVAALGALPATTVLVRVNAAGSPWYADDVAAVAGSAAAGLVLPKLARRGEIDALLAELDRRGCADAVVVAGLETGLGVADARELLPGVAACYFGAEDFIADLGGRRTRTGAEVLHARSQVVLAAHLAGVVPIDQAVVEVGDTEHFVADARDGAALGYQGKICLHPSQVAAAHEVFSPTPAEVAHAERVLTAGGAGVAVLDGEMIDEVHLRMARTVLARAGTPQR